MKNIHVIAYINHMKLLRACLVARKWAEVRKWESIIAHFLIYPNTGKEK